VALADPRPNFEIRTYNRWTKWRASRSLMIGYASAITLPMAMQTGRRSGYFEAALDEFQSDPPSFAQVSEAGAECSIHHRRVVEDEILSPRGAPLRSTNWNCSPVRTSASSRGFAIVAEQQMNFGAAR
jgi:hypothetical protein